MCRNRAHFIMQNITGKLAISKNSKINKLSYSTASLKKDSIADLINRTIVELENLSNNI